MEAGVDVVSAYPGTPSTEIGEAIASIAEKLGIYFDWAANEKVATEIAVAASWSGLRSLTMMKHVGVNVAADTLFTLTYSGVRGGMVVVAADDPQAHSSQNEQDSRHYALAAEMPMLEPSTPQEAKDFVKRAFDLSEEFRLPFLIRSTTRLSHQRGMVLLGEVLPNRKKGRFVEDEPYRYIQVGRIAIRHHKELNDKIERIRREVSEGEDVNMLEGEGSSVGVVASGVCYAHAVEAIRKLGIKVKVMKMGMSYPFPEEKFSEFVRDLDTLIVVEEPDSFVELHARAVAKEVNPSLRIVGKKSGHFPSVGEYSLGLVIKGMATALGLNYKVPDTEIMDKVSSRAPPRNPTLCPGCPHRSTGYALKRVLGGKDAVILGDIGCYALLFEKPFSLAKVSHAMGCSIGFANGFSISTDQPVVALIGDSTFFHAGVPALLDAVHHNRRMVVIILDNRITAMTGHQPHPGVSYTATGTPAKAIDIEKFVRGMGVEDVYVVDPYDHEKMEAVLRECLNKEGLSVIIARRECALLTVRRVRRSKGRIVSYRVDPEKCRHCRVCITMFGCPALKDTGEKVEIDPSICFGCGACASVCPFEAILPTEGGLNWLRDGLGV